MHQIGVGVLGPVYRTYDPGEDRLVAVKAFHLDLTPEQAQRLVDALRRVLEAGLSHPAIVAPLAVGLEKDIPYLAQEYVAAESLDAAMRHYAPAAPERALPFIMQLAAAVDAAHERGIVHGGLHLRDVFVTPDEARVNGFGVATALEVVGLRGPVRRPYTAPEVIAGRAWGPEADRFSVAAIAYELLTGKRAAGTGEQVIERLNDVAGVADAEALQSVFTTALADDPAMRDATAAGFLSAFGGAVGLNVTGTTSATAASATHAAADSARIADLLADLAPDPRTEDTDSDDGAPADVETSPGSTAAREADPSAAPPPDDPDATDLAAVDRAPERLEPPPDVSRDAATLVAGDSAVAADAREPGLPLAGAGDRPAASALNELEWDLNPPVGSDAVADTQAASANPISDSRGEPVIVPPALDRSVEPAQIGESDLSGEMDPLPATGAFGGIDGSDDGATLLEDDPDEDGQPLPGPALESADEVVPRRSSARAMVPVAIAAAVGTLVAYIVGVGLGTDDQPPGGRDPAPLADQTLESDEPAAAGREWSEATVGPGDGDRVVPRAIPTPLVAPPDPQPRSPAAGPGVAPPGVSPAPAEPVAEPETPPPVPARPPSPDVELATPGDADSLTGAGTGWLLVRTEPPGADVSVDGVVRGQTPLALRDVGYGTHRVEVSAAGYVSHVREITLSDEASVAAVRVELAPGAAASLAGVGAAGSIFVDSRPPGSPVLIDDRAVGVTPILVPGLAAGAHRVRIERDGYRPWVTTVEVLPAERTRVAGSLDVVQRQ